MTLQYPTPFCLTSPHGPGQNPAEPQARSRETPASGSARSTSSKPCAPSNALPFGLPGDRHARLAARRAFVALKQSFLYVVEGLEGKTELQSRVREAEEPEELWLLRAPVFAALAGDDAPTRSRRQLLNRSLETMFPAPAAHFC